MAVASMDLLHMDSIISLARIRFHRFAGHNQFFRNNPGRFFFNRRFFLGFDVVAFGFPYWWYPDYYYGYPDSYGYADYETSPVYDYRYWVGMATAVQAELANRGYYHGSIDGAIGPGHPRSHSSISKGQQFAGHRAD